MQAEPSWKFAPGEPYVRNELRLFPRSRWLSAFCPDGPTVYAMICCLLQSNRRKEVDWVTSIAHEAGGV